MTLPSLGWPLHHCCWQWRAYHSCILFGVVVSYRRACFCRYSLLVSDDPFWMATGSSMCPIPLGADGMLNGVNGVLNDMLRALNGAHSLS